MTICPIALAVGCEKRVIFIYLEWNKRSVRSFASLNFFSHSGTERTLGKPTQRNFPSGDWRIEPSWL